MQMVATAAAPADIEAHAPSSPAAIEVRGKFFFSGGRKHFVKGVTYGPSPSPRTGRNSPNAPRSRRISR